MHRMSGRPQEHINLTRAPPKNQFAGVDVFDIDSLLVSGFLKGKKMYVLWLAMLAAAFQKTRHREMAVAVITGPPRERLDLVLLFKCQSACLSGSVWISKT